MTTVSYKDPTQGTLRQQELHTAGLSEVLSGGVNVVGYLRTESGVGAAGRGYVRALRALGIPLTFWDVSGLQTNRFKDDSLYQPDSNRLHDINMVCADVELHYAILAHLGEEFFTSRYNIGIWAWELTNFPRKWFDRFAYYDEIWVGSSFIADVLAPVAPVPVVRIPPVLTAQCHGDRRQCRRKLGVDSGDFVFLFIFDFHSHFERKNPLAVVEAFRTAFSPGDHVHLVIKCVNAESNVRDYARLKDSAAGLPVSIHSGYWDAAAVRDLMAACDCYVSLHRSEGTGLTLSDAMALGKPVIATGWSGNMDFMSMGNSFPVCYDMVQLQENIGPYRAGESWADPSVTHAAELMRRVHDDRDAAQARGRAARRDIETNYSPHRIGTLIRQRLEAIAVRRRFAEFQEATRAEFGNYLRLPERIRQAVGKSVPDGAAVLMVSKGDNELMKLNGRPAWHFPQNAEGVYAGYYPASSSEAIDHLEALRAHGAGYLLFPRTAFWWLAHYADFRRHLDGQYQRIWHDEDSLIYRLEAPRQSSD